MHRRALSLIALLLIVSAMPLSASQFIEMPFEQVAREAKYAVRAQVVDTWSAWNDTHDLVYTYATLRVTRYFGDATGPDTLVVREVGGSVDGYVQEAIGFPALRRGEQVVMLLAEWEGSTDLRIHAYNQGKYLVRDRLGIEILVADPVKQGEERHGREHRFQVQAADGEAGITIDEFAQMFDAARDGEGPAIRNRQ